ncbi:hypothetical protein IAG44_39910 [Streptomyces roseirectus]|uniref:Uncharacterized protein n=1 Tax=Streptomyces roseirectus TaxID=2768066 RepID=A0A7H0IQB3_9ACTN|nr:hypothetical protein [Streptomyces roseirectus]QNP74979.1 hypothetical protein IAG44_39910 [Streptomyces roseirectus]
MPLLHRMLHRVRALLRRLAGDDRGVTTEYVIWIAGLSALALAVLEIFRPEIVAAAKSVVLK